ncbi:cobalamin-binding protein [Dehalogenimonas sp. THU2]|uniref:ABC transporter substrate-binding protein n=1 Tax=Dehalogenimonas sp. THU2 TaxID=3151121 RepID=UPI003218642B
MTSHLSITDHAGRSVTIEIPKHKIISLAPSNTEMVYALGAQELLHGVTEYCDFPEAAKLIPRVGGYTTVDIDIINEIQPDLILAGTIHLKGIVSKLEELGYPVIVLESNTISGMLTAIEIIGQCTGKEAVAEQLVESLRARAEAVTDKTKDLPVEKRPRVYYLHESQTWKTFGAKTIGDTLTDLAGGYNIGRDFGEYYPYPTFSDIVNSNPDIIIAETGYGENPMEPLNIALNEPAIESTKARKSGRVYGISSDLVGRAGPRMVEGLEELARIFHPGLF